MLQREQLMLELVLFSGSISNTKLLPLSLA